MASPQRATYRALIKPIPAKVNLANVAYQNAGKTCKACSTIVPDRGKLSKNGISIKCEYERVDLYPDFPDLKVSARDGCEMCRLMRKTIRTAWAERPMEEWGVGPLRENDGLWDDLFVEPWDQKVKIYQPVFMTEEAPNKPFPTAEMGNVDSRMMVTTLHLEFGPASTVAVSGSNDEYGKISRIVSFKVFDSVGKFSPHITGLYFTTHNIEDLQSSALISQRRLPGPRALSSSNLEIINTWIKECKVNHPECQIDNSRWVPSRLLDVGPLDGSELPRLVETGEPGNRGPYTALSHMWGESIPLRALTSNYEDLKVGIPMQNLSKNFAHAVVVTRELRLRYLWIDSLCIVQNLASDWDKEAATMHQVYSFAEVTIVA